MMNRQQRRKAERKGELAAGLEAMADEMTGGRVKMTTIRPVDYLDMLAAALAGQNDHLDLLHTVGELVARIAKAPPTAPMLCVACPAPLQGGYAVVVCQAASLTPRNGLGVAVCPACGPDLPSIEKAAMMGLRRLWPDLRPLHVHEAGHA